MTPVNPSPARPPASLVLIGASTGGNRVLTQLVTLLPRLPAATVIVQHMPKFINASFARTLSLNARVEVRLAEDGEVLQEGCIYLAPSERHCILVENRLLRLNSGAPVNFVCPSADVLMQSAQPPVHGQRLIGVLLTGMGKDGAAGLAHLKRLGGLTIAQDQASCTIYSMPAEAVRLGCVDHQLCPEKIAELLAMQAA